jgi:hypothetical protein
MQKQRTHAPVDCRHRAEPMPAADHAEWLLPEEWD